jgi:hypothetical protein
MRIKAAQRADFLWLTSRVPCALTERATGIKAVDDAGEIHGVVIYDNWTKNSCEAHMAVDSPIVWRSLLGPAFQYPFEQIGIGLILGIIPARNVKSLKHSLHMGFEELTRIHDGWAKGEDLVLIEMRKEKCRWLSGERKVA